jgi:hypothetical protein
MMEKRRLVSQQTSFVVVAVCLSLVMSPKATTDVLCFFPSRLTGVLFQASAEPAPSLPDQHAADLAALDQFVRDSYAFLPTNATDWNRVISALTPRARAARDRTAWLHVLEEALDALYDGHTQLNTNAPDSWRPVP